MTTPKTTLQSVASLTEALEIYTEALDGAKIFGIQVGATWNYDASVYYAECSIGDGSTHALVRIEEPAWKGSPERGSEFEGIVYDLGEKLGEWLQAEFGQDYEYGVEMS
jgi:hypothetical protein